MEEDALMQSYISVKYSDVSTSHTQMAYDISTVKI